MSVSDSPHFEIENYIGLFKKAQFELSELDKGVDSYDLFNYLCTINHLYDWVEKECKPQAMPARNKGDALHTIKQLCNRAKHFEKKSSHLETKVNIGYGAGRYGVKEYGTGEPSYKVTVDSKEIDVLTLCKEALEVWRKFLEDNKLL